MDKRYEDWIKDRLSRENPFLKCAEWTLDMAREFPELVRVRGTVTLGNLWERDHWWLKMKIDDEDQIIDPTVAQFSQDYYSGGTFVVWYQERDESEPEPTGKCPNCGGYCYDYRDLCSERCERAYAAYLMRF